MPEFAIHDLDSAPEASKPHLQAWIDKVRFIPNMFGVMAESPQALAAYNALSALWSETDLAPLERQIVLLAINHENGCRYCMASQSLVSTIEGMPAEILAALREDRPLGDPRQQALRGFAVAVVRQRGWIEEAEVDAFIAAGYSRRTVLEIVLAAAFKTLSNYTDHLTDAPIDASFAKFAWTRASVDGAAAE